MASVTYGDPWDASNLQGPVISSRQRDRVRSATSTRVVTRGARLVPRRRDPGAPAEGLLRGADPLRRRLADVDDRERGDIGPVLAVIPYDGDDEAVRIANGTMYGLSAVVTGASLDHANAVRDAAVPEPSW